jgi:ubiquitin C-terminal hydrolase
MKIFTKIILTILTLLMFAQPMNAFTLQSMKDFLSSSATKIVQSFNNNKPAYILGAVVVGAAIGIGWWYYTNTLEKSFINEFDKILKTLAERNHLDRILKKLQDIKTNFLGKSINLKDALKALREMRDTNKTLEVVTEKGESIWFYMYIDEFIKKFESQIYKPHGLVNNNSCFINAAVQCLFSLDKCNSALLNVNYRPGSLSEGYLQLVANMQKEKANAIIDSASFCQRARAKLFASHALDSQQDSVEFVERLLQAFVEEDVNYSSQNKNHEFEDLFKVTIAEKKYDSEHTEREKNKVTSPFFTITINETDEILSDCLKSYCNPYAYKPEDFPTETWTKKSVLESVSNYFVISLNRDGYGEKGAYKVEKPISFELENFNIDELSFGSQKFPLYFCKAFIVHSGGNPHSGHYIAYVRNNGTWYLCDDRSVTPVPSDIISKIARQGEVQGGGKPVMLFYEQQAEGTMNKENDNEVSNPFVEREILYFTDEQLGEHCKLPNDSNVASSNMNEVD